MDLLVNCPNCTGPVTLRSRTQTKAPRFGRCAGCLSDVSLYGGRLAVVAPERERVPRWRFGALVAEERNRSIGADGLADVG